MSMSIPPIDLFKESLNYINEHPIDIDYKKIPITWCPTKFYSISLTGESDFTFDCTNESFIRVMTWSANAISSFIKLYKEDYAFSEPQFCMKPDGTIIIRISTIELDKYEKMQEIK